MQQLGNNIMLTAVALNQKINELDTHDALDVAKHVPEILQLVTVLVDNAEELLNVTQDVLADKAEEVRGILYE